MESKLKIFKSTNKHKPTDILFYFDGELEYTYKRVTGDIFILINKF